MIARDPVAVVDVGSMTLRITIVESDGSRFSQPFITQLSAGLHETGAISAESMASAADALTEIRAICARRGATDLRAIGTEAARRASNRDELEALIGSELGVRLEVLDGQEEGRLAFDGALTDLQDNGQMLDGDVVMVDIGGASTEFVLGAAGSRPEANDNLTPDLRAYSAAMGTVTMSNAYLSQDPPGPDELSAALSVVELHIDDARRSIPELDDAATHGTVVGVGGTITTAAAVEIGLDPYDSARIHGFKLTKDAVEDVFRTLATERLDDRMHNPGLSPKRAGVIVGGLCVLVETFRQLGMSEMLVSDRGVADGIAAEMLTS